MAEKSVENVAEKAEVNRTRELDGIVLIFLYPLSVTPFYDSNGAGNRSGIKKKRRCKNHQHAVDGSSAHSTDDLRLGKPPVTLKYHLQSLSQRVSSIYIYPYTHSQDPLFTACNPRRLKSMACHYATPDPSSSLLIPQIADSIYGLAFSVRFACGFWARF